MRITVGSSWDNHFFSCKGPFFRKLALTDFKYRGCEDHFSRNVLLFNPNLEHTNLRAIFGASRDFDCDTSQIKNLKEVKVGNMSVKMAGEDYYSDNISLNSLPTGWFNTIMGQPDPLKTH